MKFERLGYYAIVLFMLLGFASPVYFVGKSEYLQRENEALRVQVAQTQNKLAQYDKTMKVAVEEIQKADPTLIEVINTRLSK